MKDGFYIIDRRAFWILDGKEFATTDEARSHLVQSGFTRQDIHQFLKGLRHKPIEIK